jgi:hypothetical protein
MDSARRLREAADAMRRAAANGAQASAAESTAARERLRDAERKLQQSQSGRAERDVRDALRQAEELAEEQKQIADDVNGVEGGRGPAACSSSTSANRASMRRSASSRSARSHRGRPWQKEHDAARRLAEAADSIRDNRVRDKIRHWAITAAPVYRRRARDGAGNRRTSTTFGRRSATPRPRQRRSLTR